MKKKLVVFTGAGISAESGLKTFRGDDGLWEGYRVQDVATPDAWRRDQKMVLDFYNIRRKQCLSAVPNLAHKILVDLEEIYDVYIITQNVDDLHERAGSTKVLHLHGELIKAQSTLNPRFVYGMETDEINVGDTCELGSQLRPYIVWFGEAVPNLEKAAVITQEADIFVMIGTSLQVYPAANLVQETSDSCQLYLVDPNAAEIRVSSKVTKIAESATVGVQELRVLLSE